MIKHLSGYLNRNDLTYNQYLNSEHWKEVRRKFWASKLHDGTCYVCGEPGKLDVHHKTYKRLGHEGLHDLCLLCRDCHQETHALVNSGVYLKKAAKILRKSKGVRMRGYKHLK